jgi:hypothetical protein
LQWWALEMAQHLLDPGVVSTDHVFMQAFAAFVGTLGRTWSTAHVPWNYPGNHSPEDQNWVINPSDLSNAASWASSVNKHATPKVMHLIRGDSIEIAITQHSSSVMVVKITITQYADQDKKGCHEATDDGWPTHFKFAVLRKVQGAEPLHITVAGGVVYFTDLGGGCCNPIESGQDLGKRLLGLLPSDLLPADAKDPGSKKPEKPSGIYSFPALS